jgi:hypothetical protein
MLEYSMMKMTRTAKWFRMMRTLAMLAVLSFVSSPVLASVCCCDAMSEASHSHASITPSDSHAGHTHHYDEHHAPAKDAPSSYQAFVGADCQHSQCEVAPLATSVQQNRTLFFMPVASLPSDSFLLSTPRVIIVSASLRDALRPLAPDRFSSSGLSPPASLWS